MTGNTFIVVLLGSCAGVHFFLHRHADGTHDQEDRP
jgi:hypothetical protein